MGRGSHRPTAAIEMRGQSLVVISVNSFGLTASQPADERAQRNRSTAWRASDDRYEGSVRDESGAGVEPAAFRVAEWVVLAGRRTYLRRPWIPALSARNDEAGS